MYWKNLLMKLWLWSTCIGWKRAVFYWLQGMIVKNADRTWVIMIAIKLISIPCNCQKSQKKLNFEYGNIIMPKNILYRSVSRIYYILEIYYTFILHLFSSYPSVIFLGKHYDNWCYPKLLLIFGIFFYWHKPVYKRLIINFFMIIVLVLWSKHQQTMINKIKVANQKTPVLCLNLVNQQFINAWSELLLVPF